METPVHQNFLTIDWIALVVYLALVVSVGSLFYKRQKDTEDFFLAGRSMHWLPAGISVMVTMLSAISYMGLPAWAYKHDMTFYAVYFSIPVALPIVMAVFQPFFCNLKLFTAYEYLERRFGLVVRMIGSAVFLVLRAFGTAVVIYAPAKALAVITGMPELPAIIVMGVLATGYTIMGGMRAVIWTDVIQFVVLFGGIVAVMFLAIGRAGGWAHFWDVGMAYHKFKMIDWTVDPTLKTSIYACLIGGTFVNLVSYGVDQVVLQRYLTTRSLRDSRRSLWFNIFAVFPVGLVRYVAGIAIFVFYLEHPHLRTFTDPDKVLPFFIVQQLPAGLSGVFVAGIFAAAMSSMDSAIHALTTATEVDWLQRLWGRHRPPGQQVARARWLTLMWGAITTFLAVFAATRLGLLIEASNKVNGFFGGVLLGIFLLGLLSTRARPWPTITGAVVGIAVGSYFAYFTDWSFLWWAPLETLVTIAVGLGLSLLRPKAPDEQAAVEPYVFRWRTPAQSEEAQTSQGI